MRRAPRSFQGLGQRWRVGISQGWQASWPYALLSERALLENTSTSSCFFAGAEMCQPGRQLSEFVVCSDKWRIDGVWLRPRAGTLQSRT